MGIPNSAGVGHPGSLPMDQGNTLDDTLVLIGLQ